MTGTPALCGKRTTVLYWLALALVSDENVEMRCNWRFVRESTLSGRKGGEWRIKVRKVRSMSRGELQLNYDVSL